MHKVSMFRRLAIAMTLSSAILLSACGEPEPLEPDTDFTFNSLHRPSESFHSQFRTMTRLMGLEIAGEENKNTPFYADIEFFPVTQQERLAELVQRGYRSEKQDGTVNLQDIDFSTQFVFVIAHPSLTQMPGTMSSNSTPGIYFSHPSVSYGEDEIHIDISARRLGGDSISAASMFSGSWDAKAYILDRKQAESLRVTLYNDEYSFSLQPQEENAPVEDTTSSGQSTQG